MWRERKGIQLIKRKMGIAEKFRGFCDNLKMAQSVIDRVKYRYHQITQRLNADFYGWSSDTLNSLYVGSYGRGTAIHISDIDVIFQMPSSAYFRYNGYRNNGQSQLLQDLRRSLLKTYSGSDVSGDGQVTDIFFSDGMKFEIVPGIEFTDGTFRYPDSNDGGRWRITDPRPEIESVRDYDKKFNGNMRRPARMVRAWKDEWNVPMGGLLIDTMAARFLDQWQYNDKSYLYYGFMTRDFFAWLSCQDDTQSYWYALGSNQLIYKRGPFSYKAKCTYNRALEAIDYENAGCQWSANMKWKEIYGSKFPS